MSTASKSSLVQNHTKGVFKSVKLEITSKLENLDFK